VPGDDVPTYSRFSGRVVADTLRRNDFSSSIAHNAKSRVAGSVVGRAVLASYRNGGRCAGFISVTGVLRDWPSDTPTTGLLEEY